MLSRFRDKKVDRDWLESNFPWMMACPAGTNAGRYVALIAEGRFEKAYRYARDPNPMASICGRVCAHPCETACRRGAIDKPISIRALKRFLTERYGPESRGRALRPWLLMRSVTPNCAPSTEKYRNRLKVIASVQHVQNFPYDFYIGRKSDREEKEQKRSDQMIERAVRVQQRRAGQPEPAAEGGLSRC